MSSGRRLLGDLPPPSFNTNEESQNYNVQAMGSSSQYLTHWPQAKQWPPIGTGMKSSDGGRLHGRPPPLSKTRLPSENEEPNTGALDNSEAVTGSGSLLSTSEPQDVWSRPPWSSSNISANLANARSNHTSTSPVRQRTNQHTRSNSPYFSPQTAIGQNTTTKSSSYGILDPTTKAFHSSGIFNSHQQPGHQSGQDGDIAGHRNFDNIHFGSMTTANGNMGYSGYNSSAASRSGSLPPSRHGMDNGSQFGEHGLSNIHQSHSEVFGHRANQLSRNSAFSTNGYNRPLESIWQSNANDLSTMASRLDLKRDEVDVVGPYVWGDQLNQQPSSSAVNGLSNGYGNGRHGSFSLESGIQSTSTTPFNQHRMSFAERSSQSPTGSDPRQSRGSPSYFNSGTPTVSDHSRAYSTSSNQSRLTMQHQAMLDRELRKVEMARRPNYAQGPAIQHRNQYGNYGNGYDNNPQAIQNMQRLNPQVQQYFPMHNVPVPGYMSNQFHTLVPRGPARDAAGGDNLRSPLLEEFRNSKGGRKYDLKIKDLYNHVVEFSGDQHGSRFIQQKLESANSDEKTQLFKEILPNALQLMTDVFGNYVIQKFFEHGHQQQKKQLADKLRGHVAELSTQMYGCRVVQKAFEHVLVDQQAELVKELEHQVLKCVKDQNGNHVIQKAIQWIPLEHISFIINAFTNQVQQLSIHSYGCRVVQRILEHCEGPAKTKILEELHSCTSVLIIDQYGNYVTQHTIEHGRPEDRVKIINLITGQFVNYSTHKYASNVVEKSIEFATPEQRRKMVEIATTTPDNRMEPTLERLTRDNYGNYVIQRLINKLESQDGNNGTEYRNFVNQIKAIVAKLKSQLQGAHTSHGKHLSQIERLITNSQFESIEGPVGVGNEPTKSSAPSETNMNPKPPQIDTSPTPSLVHEDAQSPQNSSHPSTDNNSVDGRISDGSVEVGKRQSSLPTQVAGDDNTITSESASTITSGVH